VPLIVRPASGRGGERVATPVSVGSIAPTLLALADLPRPPSMVLPLLPGLGLDGGRNEEPVYVSCGDQIAVRSGRYKLVSTRHRPRIDEVYDLENDPAEIENVAGKHPALTAKLRQLAEAYWEPNPPFPQAEEEMPVQEQLLDESTRERLRALGYLE
jgi:arylsulfatase A-like enzyme